MQKIGQEKLKNILKLEKKKYRELYSQYLVFGEHIVDEAISTNNIKCILTTDEMLYNKYNQVNMCYMLEKKDLLKFKSINNAPNLIAVCIKQNYTIQGTRVIGLNKINNPGNLGTILRTAKSFGINDIILDNDSVDLYNPKTIQSMQGVHFHMNIVEENLYQYCLKSNKSIITTFLDQKSDQEQIQKTIKDNFILIFGNEAQGIEAKFKEIQDYNFRLEIKHESLNVAIASGIIIYEMSKGENHG